MIEKSANAPSYVVGIGASAGGLEAFDQVLANTPPDTGMAFVIIQHLDPGYKANLSELLQRSTKMPVTEIEDGMTVEANHVYVIPPNKDVSIFHGVLRLLDPTQPRGLRLPVDFFFKHLAADQGERAIGVVLSGMGSDGTQGLRAIKEELGVALVQEPGSAGFDAMPKNAIDTGLADFVAPPNELPAKMVEFSRHAATVPAAERPMSDRTSSAVQKILALLRTQTGQDFSLYKPDMVYRRIKRRMAVHLLNRVPDYLRLLQEDPREMNLLFKELLIGVTNFFRDPEAFEALKQQITAHLLRDREPGLTLRAWIIGCSTGEEAYSIAIILNECLDAIQDRGGFDVQVFATDIDKDAIDTARRGVYKANITADVSPERLRRFFVLEDDTYRLKKEIREMVVFAPHDIISDPPFTKMDLVCCRNLLIYFSGELQKTVMPILGYALNAGGILFLGTSETVGSFRDLFATLDNKHKLFQRKPVQPAGPVFLPPLKAQRAPAAPATPVAGDAAVAAAVQRLMLERFAPPAILMSEDGDIIYVSGRTGKYLEPSQGKASLNAFAMAREGLRHELAILARKALDRHEEMTVRNLRVKTNGDEQLTDVTVKPIEEPGAMRNLLLVAFQESAPQPKKRKKGEEEPEQAGIVAEMERELAHTKTRLDDTIAQMEASQQQLQSTNEELQSANEELQSTNEELMTSKEEMQSLNEELVTVNAELQTRVDELSRSNSDMTNLLNSTEIATIFLDSRLNIRRFTPQATKIVKMIPTDVGRPITDLVSALNYTALADDAEEVLEKLERKEVHVSTAEGRCYDMRILPYKTVDNVIDGVVITLNDITDLLGIGAERDFASTVVETVREPLVVLAENLSVVSANRAFYRTFQVSPEETENRAIYDLGNRQWDIPALRTLLEDILPKNAEFDDFAVEHDFAGIGHRKMVLNARRMVRKQGGTAMILLAIEDVTDKQ